MHEEIGQNPIEAHGGEKGKLNLFQKIVIGVVLLLLLFVFYVSLDANKYKAYVRVVPGEGVVGVNPTTAALDFGDLSRGGRAVRRVTIENGTWLPMRIIAAPMGEIAELVDMSQNNFSLKPGTRAEIEFSVYIPASAEVDHIYGGRVYLFKIPGL